MHTRTHAHSKATLFKSPSFLRLNGVNLISEHKFSTCKCRRLWLYEALKKHSQSFIIYITMTLQFTDCLLHQWWLTIIKTNSKWIANEKLNIKLTVLWTSAAVKSTFWDVWGWGRAPATPVNLSSFDLLILLCTSVVIADNLRATVFYMCNSVRLLNHKRTKVIYMVNAYASSQRCRSISQWVSE